MMGLFDLVEGLVEATVKAPVEIAAGATVGVIKGAASVPSKLLEAGEDAVDALTDIFD